MEVNLTLYAKTHIFNEVKEIISKTEEYEKATNEVKKAQTEYELLSQKYDAQVRQLRNSSSSQGEYNNNVKALQARANEELDPLTANLDKTHQDFEKIERKLISEYLPKKVMDELNIINDKLNEYKIENMKNEKPVQRGKLGLAGLLNLSFETDKKTFKEIKKLIEKTPFKKVEVFIESI